MRSDQIAVLLREFANRCMQWAAVLETEEQDVQRFPDVLPPLPVPVVPFPGVATSAAAQLPSPSTAGAFSHEHGPALTSYEAAARLPLTFRCPSCGQIRRWHLAKPPWPDAVCQTCYAERQDHREGT